MGLDWVVGVEVYVVGILLIGIFLEHLHSRVLELDLVHPDQGMAAMLVMNSIYVIAVCFDKGGEIILYLDRLVHPEGGIMELLHRTRKFKGCELCEDDIGCELG